MGLADADKLPRYSVNQFYFSRISNKLDERSIFLINLKGMTFSNRCILRCILAGIILSVLAGCLVPNAGTRVPAHSSARSADGTILPPRKGMTKAQVRAAYGEPARIISTGNGETWAYLFDESKIPFWLGAPAVYESLYRPSQSCSIYFGLNGTVTNYTFDNSRAVARPTL